MGVCGLCSTRRLLKLPEDIVKLMCRGEAFRGYTADCKSSGHEMCDGVVQLYAVLGCGAFIALFYAWIHRR